jgi:hypothetical protein
VLNLASEELMKQNKMVGLDYLLSLWISLDKGKKKKRAQDKLDLGVIPKVSHTLNVGI